MLDAGCDHVVISGDIVSTADPDDYHLAREIFASFGLLRPERLTMVPGNHDIFGGPHRAVDVLSFPHHIRAVDHRRMMNLYAEAFAETFVGATRLSPATLFPCVKQVGPFALLCLNSVPHWSLKRNPLGSNGDFDEDHQSVLADPALSARWHGLIPVAVMHHHFHDIHDDAHGSTWWARIESRTMRMRRRRRTLQMFHARGIRAVLHGHVHRNDVYHLGGLVLANGAGAVCDDPVRMLKYNILSATDDGVQITTRILDVPYQADAQSRPIHSFTTIPSLPQTTGS